MALEGPGEMRGFPESCVLGNLIYIQMSGDQESLGLLDAQPDERCLWGPANMAPEAP